MQEKLSHERLDLYKVYMDVAGQCGEIITGTRQQIEAFDHLDRAIESIGVNFMRANVYRAGSAQRSTCLDVSIASAHECAAALDVCMAKDVIMQGSYADTMKKLWRIRGMLLGMKRSHAGQVREQTASYGSPRFPFMNLDLYKVSLKSVRWTHDLLEELTPKGRTRRKLDTSTTGTVLNIAEGHGRSSIADQNRFMKLAEDHAFQTLLSIDLMISRGEMLACRSIDGKAIQARIVSMLHAWRTSSEKRIDYRE